MNNPQQQDTSDIHISSLFGEYLFGSPADSLADLSYEEDLLYYKVNALIEQQEQLASFIPSPPAGIVSLLKELESENTDFNKIKNLAQQDPNIVGEIIRVSNSPLYLTRSGDVTSLEKAISLLGLNGVMKVATVVMMRKTLSIETSRYKPQMLRLWNHCVNSAESCQMLGETGKGFENFVLGLVHDIGAVTVFSLVSHCLDELSAVTRSELKVLQRVVEERSTWLSTLVAAEWHLPEHYLLVLNEYDRIRSGKMDEDDYALTDPQARLVQLGSICARVFTLIRRGNLDRASGLRALASLGVDEKTLDRLFTRLDLAGSVF